MSAIVRRDRKRVAEAVLARAGRRRSARCRCIARRTSRPRTPCRASRESPEEPDDAEPPRIASRSDAANRRGQSARCRAPQDTRGTAGVLALEAQARRRRSVSAGRRFGLPSLTAPRLPSVFDEPTISSCRSRRGDDDVAGHVHLRVVARSPPWIDEIGVPITGRPSGGRRRRPRDQIVHELPAAHRRTLRSLEHDVALGVQLGERRREHHLAHHVHCRLELMVGDACIDKRVLA